MADSLALDLMEAVRPRVDANLLGLLRSHRFAARDFFETRQGVCRVLPPMTHRLAETAPVWATAVAPLAEGIARALIRADGRPAKRDLGMPTPLTQMNRSAGRDGLRQGARRERVPNVALPSACLLCGVVLDRRDRDYCDDCLPDRRSEQAAAFAQAGPAVLAVLRADSIDPAHGGAAGRKRGERNAAHVAAVERWRREHGAAERDVTANPHAFACDILPGLQSVPLRVMADATGLSESYCSFVRRGQKVPHRRHWTTLARLT